MGQGSYQGPQVLLPSAPAGLCQAESTRPSLSSRDSLMPPDPNPQAAVPPQAHLDAASQDAAHQLLVEAGVLLTLRHQVEQGRRQRRDCAVLFQGFGQSLVGAHVAHHHHTVLAGTAQAVQEANDLLQHLLRCSREQTRGTAGNSPGAPSSQSCSSIPLIPAPPEPGQAQPDWAQGHQVMDMARTAAPHLSQHLGHKARLPPAGPCLPSLAEAQPAQPPCLPGVPGPPHLPAAAVGDQEGHTGLHTLVPGQHILLVTVQELVQDPG